MPSKSSEKAFNLIVEALKEDDVSMIGLYGMAGVGKTTLANEVGKKARELRIFYAVLICVSDSRHKKHLNQIADILDLRFKKKTQEGRKSSSIVA